MDVRPKPDGGASSPTTGQPRAASRETSNSTSIGSSQEFDLIENADGSIGFRAHANRNYVTAESAGASPLIANRNAIGLWESFDLIYD